MSRKVRKKVFHATSGLSLDEQIQVAKDMQSSEADTLQRLTKIKFAAKLHKKQSRENNLKFEWFRERNYLNELEMKMTMDLESFILRAYNKANTSISTPSEENNQQEYTTLKRDYIKDLDELLKAEQINRVALLAEKSSERNQQHAMKLLLQSVSQKCTMKSTDMRANSNEATDNGSLVDIKDKAKQLIYDAILAQHMLEIKLEEEIVSSEEELRISHTVIASLMEDKKYSENPLFESTTNELQSNNTTDNEKSQSKLMLGENSHFTTLINESLGNSRDKSSMDSLFRLEMLDALQQLSSDHQAKLAKIEGEFREQTNIIENLEHMNQDTPTTSRWPSFAEERFSAVMKAHERSKCKSLPEILYKKLAIALPQYSHEDLKIRVKLHHHMRFYREKVEIEKNTYNRKLKDLCESFKANNIDRQRIKSVEKKKAIQWEKFMNENSERHEKLKNWQVTREAEERIRKHQHEFEKMMQDQQSQIRQAKADQEQQNKRALVAEFRDNVFLKKVAKEMQDIERSVQQQHELAQQSVINEERVIYRKQQYEQKLKQKQEQENQKRYEERRRQEHLIATKQDTPYAQIIANIVPDPERVRQETTAFRANVEAGKENLPLHETGLFPSHGYDTDTLFKNARFRLGLALRDAGLGSTDYARSALAQVKMSNIGSYRHHVPTTNQIW